MHSTAVSQRNIQHKMTPAVMLRRYRFCFYSPHAKRANHAQHKIVIESKKFVFFFVGTTISSIPYIQC